MIKVGIIGSGFGLYGHLPAFNSLKDCRVTCISGTRGKRLTDYCKKTGLKNIYTDWRLMLKSEPLDAVAIAVPPAIQYQAAKSALKRGLHVFAEKPLAKNLAQARELAKLAKQKNLTTAVDFIFPEIKQWQQAKALIRKQAYGKLKAISVNWEFESYDIKNRLKSWKTMSKLRGGALAFYFSHSLYYLEDFAGELGKIESVLTYSKESLGGGETGVDALLEFKNKVNGYAHLSANTKGHKTHRLEFICERGTLVLENTSDVTRSFTLKLFTNKGEKILGQKIQKHRIAIEDERVQQVKSMAQRFIKACQRRRQIKPSFSDGVRVQALIDRIKRQQI